MPNTARVWIYGGERALSAAEANLLTASMNSFLKQWTAHKRELKAAWEVRYQRFVIIAVDEQMMSASGCSIDSLVRHLAELGRKLNIDLVGAHAKVFFRDSSHEIRCVDRSEFKRLIETAALNEDTIVFDNTVATVGLVRAGKWETPMKNSWHMEAFGRAPA
jgi:hypothetical protein